MAPGVAKGGGCIFRELLISLNEHSVVFFIFIFHDHLDVFNPKRILMVALFMLSSALPMVLDSSTSSCAAGWLCTVPLTYATFRLE